MNLFDFLPRTRRFAPFLPLGLMMASCSYPSPEKANDSKVKNDRDSWNLVWSDEFDGPNLDDGKWVREVRDARWINNERQAYTDRPENVRTENGNLVLEGRRDYFKGEEYSSGRVRTEFKASWVEGRIEARMQLPGGIGTWPGFFLLPDDQSLGWPGMGELDIMEEVGYDSDVILAAHHSNSVHDTATRRVPAATTEFHTYAAEWGPERIDIFIDDVRFFTTMNQHTGTDQWPFNKNFHIVLALAIGGNWGGIHGVDNSIWPRQLLVDYVRVYKR